MLIGLSRQDIWKRSKGKKDCEVDSALSTSKDQSITLMQRRRAKSPKFCRRG